MWPPRIFRNRRPASSGQNFSARNGELLLRKQIAFSRGRRSNPIRTFTLAELQEMLHKSDRGRLGCGGFSAYFWTILDDREVVVKYFGGDPGGDFEDQLVEELITEIVILSGIRRGNVVKLLGCCLETRVPALVYEFVPRRDLACNMGRWRREGAPPWSTRLQIALDVADALSYLHSHTSGPIVHRNMQTKSILLDEDYSAKLCSFGNSIPIHLREDQAEDEIVYGAYRYIDPEYLATGIFTEKADIHPLGLILIELLTGERFHTYSSREDRDVILAAVCIWQREDLQGRPAVDDVEYSATVAVGEAMTERQPTAVLEEACLAILVADASTLEDAEGRTDQLRAFARLALRCARPRPHERPAMKEVVEELRRIKSMVALP